MRLLSSSVITAIVTTALSPMGANAQDQGSLYKEVKGWAIHRHSSSESSPRPSCSAVLFKDHATAMRVERFDQGYFYGVNGLNRNEQGQLYGLSFWFDGDRSNQQGGEASFGRDTAYPYDDWLSFFHPYEERDTLVAAIANRNMLSFAFMMPGNRSGNDEVTIDFALTGSAAALLALEECYQVASGTMMQTTPAPQANAAPGPESASDCPDGGPRLPLSKICQGRGVNYLNIAEGKAPGLLQGCEWKLNEAAMPGGDVLLYMAASCGPHTTQLEFSAGARFAEVSVVQSALNEGGPGDGTVTVATIDEADPKRSILEHTQNAMDDKAEAAKCRVNDYHTYGAFTVSDMSSEEELQLALDGPLDDACGPFGRKADHDGYWRVFDGYAWFFEFFAQDGEKDFDPRTLTVITPANNGG